VVQAVRVPSPVAHLMTAAKRHIAASLGGAVRSIALPLLSLRCLLAFSHNAEAPARCHSSQEYANNAHAVPLAAFLAHEEALA
jgi:hypothetical protein